ncbi:MAG: phosphopantetheine-binding protein, partial [Actinocatenispora sp.]
GRVDDQVKIRGFRVEPAEVTVALREHPAVRDAYTLADRTGPIVRLVVFLVWASDGDAAPDRTDLHGFLGARLPAYMLPAEYVPLAALPLTVNGKVDRSSLRVPAPAAEPAAPAGTELEVTLAALWAEVLNRESVGLDDDFYALGGHSLLLNQIRARLARQLGRRVPLAALFEYLTVRELAGYLSGSE